MTVPNRLPFHEWLIVTLIILILVALTIITSIHNPKFPEIESTHELVRSTLFVKVEGAVKYPGNYELEKGSCIEDAMQVAQALSYADLKSLRLKKRIKDGQTIRVKEKPFLTVYIEGAVENPGSLQVPEGTTFCGLTPFVHLLAEADHSILKKKRKLKNGETIFIPSKRKVNKNSWKTN